MIQNILLAVLNCGLFLLTMTVLFMIVGYVCREAMYVPCRDYDWGYVK